MATGGASSAAWVMRETGNQTSIAVPTLGRLAMRTVPPDWVASP